MSKIQKQLEQATGLTQKRGENADDYRGRLVAAISELSDKEWDALPKEGQDYFNEAVDMMNGKKPAPEFPDAELEKSEPTARRSSTKKAAEPAPEPAVSDEPQVGDTVKVVTKRGKESVGEVVEIDDTILVLKSEDGEEEFQRSRLESVTVEGAVEDTAAAVDAPTIGDVVKVVTKRGKEYTGELLEVDGDVIVVQVGDEEMEFQRDRVESVSKEGGAPASEAASAEAEPKVGDTVKVVTKRGKEHSGEVVEIDDEILVITAGGKEEEEFQRTRLESVTVEGAAKTSTRRASTKEATTTGRTSTKAAAAAPTEKKKISAKANGGVSATQRMRELILDDMKADEAAIAKALKNEKLEFKDNTLSLVYSEVHRLLEMMRARKLIK